jgi:hypothetical protein
MGGEGIVGAADGRDGAVERAGRMVGRRLEHQMFEEMGDAGLARRLIRAADLVPHHMGDDRRAVIGDDDDLHTVVEHEICRLAVGRLVAGQNRGAHHESQRQERSAQPFSLKCHQWLRLSWGWDDRRGY